MTKETSALIDRALQRVGWIERELHKKIVGNDQTATNAAVVEAVQGYKRDNPLWNSRPYFGSLNEIDKILEYMRDWFSNSPGHAFNPTEVLVSEERETEQLSLLIDLYPDIFEKDNLNRVTLKPWGGGESESEVEGATKLSDAQALNLDHILSNKDFTRRKLSSLAKLLGVDEVAISRHIRKKENLNKYSIMSSTGEDLYIGLQDREQAAVKEQEDRIEKTRASKKVRTTDVDGEAALAPIKNTKVRTDERSEVPALVAQAHMILLQAKKKATSDKYQRILLTLLTDSEGAYKELTSIGD